MMRIVKNLGKLQVVYIQRKSLLRTSFTVQDTENQRQRKILKPAEKNGLLQSEEKR